MGNSYTIEVKELKDSNGDCYLEFPPDLLKKLEWVDGDNVKFIPKENGSFSIKKVQYETVELDFDDEELFKYMQLAHEKNMSFNDLVEGALQKAMTRFEFENECG